MKLHLLDRLYGPGAHKAFKHIMGQIKPATHYVAKWRFGKLPDLEVVWDDGAYIRFRLNPSTVHVQELVNSSSGAAAEGLYRALAREVPAFFRSWGCRTMTCEPSDDEARKRLATLDVWEIWTSSRHHDVWVWWLEPRTLKGIHQGLGFAHSIQKERDLKYETL